MAHMYSVVWTYHSFFINSSVIGHLSHFYTLTIILSAPMIIGVHLPFDLNILCSWNGCKKWNHWVIWIFFLTLLKVTVLFHKGWNRSYTHQQWMRVLFPSYIVTNAGWLFFVLFFFGDPILQCLGITLGIVVRVILSSFQGLNWVNSMKGKNLNHFVIFPNFLKTLLVLLCWICNC